MPSVTDNEITQLLNLMLEQYGYDFLGYTRASVKRRILRLMSEDKVAAVQTMMQRIKLDAGYARRFIEEITVNVTEMFRDTSFYQCLRNTILPILNTYPLIRIWHAG